VAGTLHGSGHRPASDGTCDLGMPTFPGAVGRFTSAEHPGGIRICSTINSVIWLMKSWKGIHLTSLQRQHDKPVLPG
jgi:hypothetical protein